MFKQQKNHFIPFLAHAYPVRIQNFLLCIALSILLFVPYFIIYEADKHINLEKKINSAEKFLNKKKYLEAIQAYNELITTYPKYAKAKKNAAQAAFYLVDENIDDDFFFYLGLSFLAGEEYTEDEHCQLVKALPNKYKQKFNYLVNKKNV
ncbi:MAG: hypothetical protein ACXWL2_05180 [Candidatus Chromulinivorax sp.]